MGIQGLLPALKSIQSTKHLSEFSGQTIAVDAYVWLHKGVFTCATELATGKPTHRYVDYAMEKVRLLRYHGIEPYIVFDGGPLPAKKGTEMERKSKRDEQLTRGNLLASQGRHSQARECYLKCVDVTPQMAYQLIKALRAESVQYVVAPYEADAQLAYLERRGIVSAILTEDSDLLVFGCKTVLFKFDPVARTVVSISRSDFGSVTANSSDANGISLVGWSDNQFRSMAILSGCDYLPSIPGIGLKTACALLRKFKTPQAVIKQIALEGKKRVPKGYLEHFKLAEKCFLHQRVYDSSLEKLVYLTDVNLEDWDELSEAYVGRDLEPALAKKLATGEVDPVTLEGMEDINPNFHPHSRILRDLPNGSNFKGKSKEKIKPINGGILSFFGPNPIIPRRARSPPPKPIVTTGKASGKRTLAEVLGQDLAAKKKRKSPSSAPTSPNITSSKFFGTSVASNVRRASSGGSVGFGIEKENLGLEEEDCPANDEDSLVAQGHVDPEMAEDIELEDSPVEQEDGYISPSPSMSRDFDDLSSPIQPRTRQISPQAEPGGLDFGVDPISSPPAECQAQFWRPGRPASPNTSVRVLVKASPEISTTSSAPIKHDCTVDLRDSFGNESSSEIDSDNDHTPTPSPLTPEELAGDLPNSPDHRNLSEAQELDDPEEREILALASRTDVVAAGWRKAWAFETPHLRAARRSRILPEGFLRRRETNVTPTGRHRLSQGAQNLPLLHTPFVHRNTSEQDQIFIPSKPASRSAAILTPANSVRSRKSLSFQEVQIGDYIEAVSPDVGPVPENTDNLTRLRFERFRCP
ncbi:hypothetical protein GYMLUDRAFT_35906 [Collybiopsis luxurians FD-317 M1]|nr:hypothetical protein GYMLUDRAFT_35906 [Collybiopsis luxurians FD-317 M1]